MKYALIDKNNKVKNIIIWDGLTNIQWQNDLTAVPCTTEHEIEFNNNYISIQNNELSLTNEELEILKNILNRTQL